jgi:hypothetical protein
VLLNLLEQDRISELRHSLCMSKTADDLTVLAEACLRLSQLRREINSEHSDCIDIAHEVLPNAPIKFAHQAAWVMNAEIKRLRALLIIQQSQQKRG